MASFHDYLQPYLEPLRERLDDIEKRLAGIEGALVKLLPSFEPEETGTKPPKPAFVERIFDAKTGPYTYVPLDSTLDEIRILTVHNSSSDDDPITCELQRLSLKGDVLSTDSGSSQVAKEFKTLSYTWGSPETDCSITLEGHQFPVTTNLMAALKHMRSVHRSTPVVGQYRPNFWWIDAICINQNDIAERSWQVNLMTRIYKKASGVHIWLGEEQSDGSRAMDLVSKLGKISRRGPGDAEIVYPTISADERDMNWAALTTLFRRPWWERVWVRQEIAVAMRATVHYGSQTCLFEEITATADTLNKIDEQLGYGPIYEERINASSPLADGLLMSSPYAQACSVAGFRTGGRTKHKAFNEVLLHTRSCKATDLRDKVFSMLGLIDPEFWILKPDYSLSINEVFITAARCIISKSQSLDILAGCQNPKRDHGLPSWTPNLFDTWKSRPFPTFFHGGRGVVPADGEPDFEFEGECNAVLRAKGYRVDVLKSVTSDTPNLHSSTEELDQLSRNWRAFLDPIVEDPRMHPFDRSDVQSYRSNDGPWISFLSGGSDSGQPRPVTATPLKTRGNYQMVKSLLLPPDSDELTVNSGEMRGRIREQLRKYGVGRRLAITKLNRNNGAVLMIPEDTEPDDEIWAFRGTKAFYTMRRLVDETYVVVGDAYCQRYFHYSPPSVLQTIRIV